MFPSSNNGNDPLCYIDQQSFNRQIFNDINPNYKQEEPPLSLFHLPSPFLPYELELEDDDIFSQQNYHDLVLQQQPLRAINTIVSETIVNMVDSSKNQVNELSKICTKKSHLISTTHHPQIPRKRSSKRDRHSKINTAQGPRDRRMRLSLKVARDFFNLQDKLGFDKPSKTVEWLLIRAKQDIEKISSGLPQVNYSCSVKGTKSASSTSECEVLSGIDEATIKESSNAKAKPSLSVKKEKKTKPSRKTAFHTLARESRDKRRARARERTKEKLLTRKINEPKPSEEATANHELQQLSCWSPFETGEESGSHNLNPSLEVLAEVDALSSQEQQEQLDTTEGMIDDSMVIMSKWSPSSILSYVHSTGIQLPQEHQLTDIQSLFRSWEAYNIHSLH